ncbi:traB domain-containing protein-like [Brassica napus]|uniref:traB domain-containing protein-like n=1 Tax=Brassica napus TaxID=3708 RepID=UPI00207933F8|nr:traB domain-containing protein-like [Brassica napus]
MEPMQSPSEVHSGEDFVHMEDSKPTGVMSLSDSIVNVEKADLLDKAVEEEEGNKVSDSVVSGGNGADVGECSPETRRVDLPEDLTKSLVILTCESIGNNGSCDVYLIGTDHASKESCRQVQAIISILKPEVVFLELCCRRMSALQSQTTPTPTMSDMIKNWKQRENMFEIFIELILAKISIKDVDVYGDEFRVAYEEALKYGGKVVLGDRHQEITFKRTWAKMPLWLKVKCIYFTLFVAFFLPSAQVDGKELEEMDSLDTTTQMSKDYPSVMDTFVHERDQYMSYALLSVASERSSVVAVVGSSHIDGIKKKWKQPISMKDLMEIPESVFKVKRIVSSVAIGFAGIAIVSVIRLTRRR